MPYCDLGVSDGWQEWGNMTDLFRIEIALLPGGSLRVLKTPGSLQEGSFGRYPTGEADAGREQAPFCGFYFVRLEGMAISMAPS